MKKTLAAVALVASAAVLTGCGAFDTYESREGVVTGHDAYCREIPVYNEEEDEDVIVPGYMVGVPAMPYVVMAATTYQPLNCADGEEPVYVLTFHEVGGDRESRGEVPWDGYVSVADGDTRMASFVVPGWMP